MEPKSAHLVLPGHSFDEFPTDQTESDADAMLASWTAMWHPKLIASIKDVPGWKRVEELSELTSTASIFVVTNVARSEFNEFQKQGISDENIVLFCEDPNRDSFVRKLLSTVDVECDGVTDDIVFDFFALGYCYLQIELLTKHMRYSSSVEESNFKDALIEAAEFANSGDSEKAKTSLQTCFDLLTQEREHYYAVEVYLLDLALVVPQLPDSDILAQIDSSQKTNFILSGQSLEQIASRSESITTNLKQSLQDGNSSIIGGEFTELPTSLVSSEVLLENFLRGFETYDRHLEQRPTAFGRRRFGLSATLPQLLNRSGFNHALHATMDDGRFPEATQSKSRWEGSDSSGIDAIMRAPLDGTKAQTFLKLASSISDSMDMDHVATKSFVHWAGKTNHWFGDLLRTTKYTNALGRFVTVAEYFEESYDSGMHETYLQSQYRSPYLAQAVQKNEVDPVSRNVRSWRRQTMLSELQSVRFLIGALRNEEVSNDEGQTVERLASQHSSLIESSDIDTEWTDSALAALQASSKQLADLLLGQDESAEGCLVINPFNFTNRSFVSELDSIPNDKPVYVTEPSNHQAIIDVPSMGFCWLPSAHGKANNRSKQTAKIAEERTLRNEFVEVEVDAKTGGLRYIRDYGARANRLSLQLARRLDSATLAEDDDSYSSLYSKMVAKEIKIGENSAIRGEIIVDGELVDGANALALFKLIYRLERGSRVLGMSIDLEPVDKLSSDPWNSYYAIRSAWQNEACDIYGSLQETRQRFTAKRFESPLFVEIDDAERRTAILTGGLAYHRRVGQRMLDTILICKGETTREFEIGIGADVQNPFRESKRLLSTPIVLRNQRGPKQLKTSWLFHTDARNVVANSWSIRSGERKGFVVRFAEIECKTTKVTVSAVRNVAEARKTDFLGQTLDHCEVDGNKITFSMHGHELAQIEVDFAG